MKKKRAMLESEGVTFDSKGRVSVDCLHSFDGDAAAQKPKAGQKKRKR